MTEPEPFDQFLARTAAACPEDYPALLPPGASGAAVPAEVAAEFGRMKDYLRRYYEGVQPVRTFLDAAGHPVDCVPFSQLPTVRAAVAAGLKVPTPHPHPPAAGHRQPPCPGDSVPLPRITLEHLTRYRTLDDFFRKGPPPAPRPEGPGA